MSMSLMVEAMKIKVGNPTRKLVLIKLADNANDQGECWPSYANIADHCETSKRSVMTHIKQLEIDGLLRREYRKGIKGNSSNIYHLTLRGSENIALDPSENTSPPSENISPPPSENISPRTSHSLEPVNEPKDICAFEAFWAAYPTKAKKKTAQQKFNIAVKNSKLTANEFSQKLINDIQKRLELKQFGFDKLHATTYLNQERWNDDYPANQQAAHAEGRKPTAIEAHNAMLLAKYGHTDAQDAREINSADDFGLAEHEVRGSVSQPLAGEPVTIDMGAGDQRFDG